MSKTFTETLILAETIIIMLRRWENENFSTTITTIIFRKRVNATMGIRLFYAHGSEKSPFVRDKGEIRVLHKQT